MAKLTRKTQKIFADSAAASQITAFGSIKANSPNPPVYSKDPDIIQSNEYMQGWSGATQDDYAPYRQDMNAIQNLVTRQLAYIFQAGIPEYDSATQYYANCSFCQYNGNLYLCIQDALNKNPSTEPTYWKVFDLSGYAPLNSPAFTGIPTAPTQLSTDNSTAIATTAFVKNLLGNYALLNSNNTFTKDNVFTKRITGYLQGYTAHCDSTLDYKYKKLATIVAKNSYYSKIIPFIISRGQSSPNSGIGLGSITLRVGATAGTLDTNLSAITITNPFMADFVNDKFRFHLVYKDNTPDSSSVTVHLYLEILSTYTGIVLTPIQNTNGGSILTYGDITWYNPNNSGETSLPADYTDLGQRIISQTPTPIASDNSNNIATTAFVQTAVSGASAGNVPTGTILSFGGSSVPTGYLRCNGAAVSRTTYSALFSVIGTTWGAGNDSTTFNLPNLNKRFLQDGTVGTYNSESLPNITGETSAYMRADGIGAEPANSALYTTQSANVGEGANNRSGCRVILDASRSSSVYQDNARVQPNNAEVMFIIKY